MLLCFNVFGFFVNPLKWFTRGSLNFFNFHEFYFMWLVWSHQVQELDRPSWMNLRAFFKVVIYATVLKTNKTKHSQQILNCN